MPQATKDPAWADGVAHTLVDPVLLGDAYVGFPLAHAACLDGDDHVVGPGQCLTTIGGGDDRAGALAVSTIRRTSFSAPASLSASMSMSTSSVSPSSGKLRMSRARFLVNTTLPAPIKATLTLETSSQPARGRADRQAQSVSWPEPGPDWRSCRSPRTPQAVVRGRGCFAWSQVTSTGSPPSEWSSERAPVSSRLPSGPGRPGPRANPLAGRGAVPGSALSPRRTLRRGHRHFRLVVGADLHPGPGRPGHCRPGPAHEQIGVGGQGDVAESLQ